MDLENRLSTISLQDQNEKGEDEKTDSEQKTNAELQDTSASESEGDSEARKLFMKYVTEGRRLVEQGDIARAIKLNEKALAIKHSEKLVKRIEKMKTFLAAQQVQSDGEGEEDEDMKSLGQGFMLHRKLCAKLYHHQKEGVLWMWSLFVLGKGGILADDMGLGKTIQVIAFLAGMFDMNKIKSVMIVVPLSVIPNWLNEFNKWTPGINVMQFHGSSRKERDRALNRVRSRGGVLITTYGLIVTTHETLSKRYGQEFVWDYVILDEGHKIKNPTKTSKSIHAVPAKMRMILTGTPVQNNLKELWSLFDYVHQGSLLGTMRTFKLEFEGPIIRARERDASAVAKRLGQEMAETLKGIIKPYFLRRTKAEVTAASSGEKDTECMQMPSMTRKNDLVIWLHLTEAQQKIYQDFINLDSVKQLLMTKKSPLVALTVLKKICDHPRLLSKRACMQLGLDGNDFDLEDLEHPEAYESAVLQINNISDEVLVGEAGKMQILVQLMDNFKAEGRKTLVFSQSRRMLDIIQKVITNRGHKVCRMDGTITGLAERGEIVQKFQKNPSYTAFLLTVQVGGVGLTITSADRVIIYDPNWNPATDAQAVDRAYRIGQQKNVVVYRLITCGTVEEKIYRRQVFKDSITRQTTGGNKNPYRYFTSIELRELFALDDPMTSKTQRQLQDMHAGQRKSDISLDEHIAFLHSLDIFGISDHDLMFQNTTERNDEEENEFIGEEETQRDEHFIKSKILQAQNLIAVESQNPFAAFEERSKGGMRYPPTARPAPESVPDYRPSPLFTNVQADVAVEVGDSDDEEEETKPVSNQVEESNSTIDLTEEESDDTAKPTQSAVIFSPPKKILKTAVPSPAKNCSNGERPRRILQPLNSEQVKMRSPTVVHGAQKGPVITEELLISPDVSSPVIGLEKVDIRQRMLREESERKASLSSSPRRLPMSPGAGSAKVSSSPKQGTPNKSYSVKDSRLLDGKSPNRAMYSHSPILQQTGSPSVLAADSFLSNSFTTPPSRPGSQLSRTSMSNSPALNVSDARRKLSFVEDSPIPSSANQSSIAAGDNDRTDTPAKSKQLSLLVPDGGDGVSVTSVQASPFKVVSPAARLKDAKKKRRSVCVQQCPDPSAMAESSDEDNLSPGPSSEEDENKENASTEAEEEEPEKDVSQEEESEEENKENEIGLRRLAGRNRIISESESSDGSCFEVPVSDDEALNPDLESDPSDEELQKLKPSEQGEEASKEACQDREVEEEDDDMTEEHYQQFQDLVGAARQQYKLKHYEDSLLLVEAALKISREPGLEDMAEKIRLRIASQQQ